MRHNIYCNILHSKYNNIPYVVVQYGGVCHVVTLRRGFPRNPPTVPPQGFPTRANLARVYTTTYKKINNNVNINRL